MKACIACPTFLLLENAHNKELDSETWALVKIILIFLSLVLNVPDSGWQILENSPSVGITLCLHWLDSTPSACIPCMMLLGGKIELHRLQSMHEDLWKNCYFE